MRIYPSIVVLICGVFSASLLAQTETGNRAEPKPPPQRSMNVSQGPDTVFDTDVANIIPQLKGAVATRENGRIGNEMVFWGYRLANGDQAYMYACAPLKDVDCIMRRQMICPVETRLIAESNQSGQISHFKCSAVCNANAPTVLPCCKELMEQNTLMVGLVGCQ